MRDRVAHNDAKGHHAAKGKHPLCNADGNQPRPPKAMLYRALEAARPAQLAVDDDQTDGPVHHDGQRHEEKRARQQARLPHCIRLPDDAGTDDGVCHVHKGRLEPGLGAPQLGLGGILLVVIAGIPLSGHRYARRLEIRQQRHAVRVEDGAGAVVKVESIVGRQRGRRREAAIGPVVDVEDVRRQIELHPAWRPRCLYFGLEIGSRCLQDARDDAEVVALRLSGQQASVFIVEVGLAVVLSGHDHCNVAASCPVTIFARTAEINKAKREKSIISASA